MNDRLRALSSEASLEVVIVVGTEHFDNGEFTLRVSGNGAAKLVQKRAGETRAFDTTLDAAALSDFGNTLADNEFTKERTSTMPREPGDTPVVLELHDGDERLFKADIWEADRYKDKALAAILRAAEGLIVTMVGEGNYP